VFKETIRQTPFTTDGADEYFADRIFGDSFDTDSSFLGTLRALMDVRIPDESSIHLRIISSNVNKTTLERGYEYVFNRVLSFLSDENNDSLFIFNLNSFDSECNNTFMNMVRESFIHMYGQNWHVLEDVTSLYKSTFDCVCFVNPSIKSSIVFVTDMNNRKYHYLQCAAIGMLPWYFDRQKGVTPEESALIFSLREKTPDKYLDAITKLASRYDFETARIKRLLLGFETRIERAKIDELAQELQYINNQINEYNNMIGTLISKANDNNIRLSGLMSIVEKKEPNDSELMNYFQANKSLYLENIDGSKMYFCVKGPVCYWDPDIAKHMMSNDESFVYTYCARNHVGKKDVKDLMTKIFVDQEVQLKFCAAYQFNLNGSVRGVGNHSFPAFFDDYMPNPHINRYECLGNYSTEINRFLKDGKYIEAIEQCIASSRSLNWADYYVMDNFFSNILSENRKCFILPDGTETNIRGALEWVVKTRADDSVSDQSNETDEV